MMTKNKLLTVFGVFVGYKFIYRRKSSKLELPMSKIYLPQNQSKNAIVVGAGVAGVSTAHELGKRGYNVVVLDASSSASLECSATMTFHFAIFIASLYYHSQYNLSL